MQRSLTPTLLKHQVPPPSDPQPPSLPNSPPGFGSVDGDVEPPLLTLDQPTAQVHAQGELNMEVMTS